MGTFVTNPLTRHPAVTAGAIASINELSDGRAFLGIGTGDSAVYNVGLKAARLAEFREALEAIKGFLYRRDPLPGQNRSPSLGQKTGSSCMSVPRGQRPCSWRVN